MLRLFLRLYLFLMLPATAAFVLFMYVTDQVMAQMHAEQQRARAAGAFERAERIINDTRVPDWQGRLKLIEETFRVEHAIVPLSQAQDDWFMSGVGEGAARGRADRASRPSRRRAGVPAPAEGLGPRAAHRVGGCVRIHDDVLRDHHRAGVARDVRHPLPLGEADVARRRGAEGGHGARGRGRLRTCARRCAEARWSSRSPRPST